MGKAARRQHRLPHSRNARWGATDISVSPQDCKPRILNCTQKGASHEGCTGLLGSPLRGALPRLTTIRGLARAVDNHLPESRTGGMDRTIDGQQNWTDPRQRVTVQPEPIEVTRCTKNTQEPDDRARENERQAGRPIDAARGNHLLRSRQPLRHALPPPRHPQCCPLRVE